MSFALASGAAAADETLRNELAALYQRHNELMSADKVDEALALRTAEVKADLTAELAKGSEQERAETRDMLRGMTPDSFEVMHLEAGEEAADLLIVGSKKMPFGPDAGKIKRIEIEVAFAKEGGQWRIGVPTFLMDPDAVKRLTNIAYEPIENYDQDREIDLGGRIVRAALEAGHTLVVIRMLDEEQALYLPNRAELEKYGFDVELLRPFATVSASGHPHKTNTSKIWVTGLNVSK
jgi:hypothetical protein